MKCLMHVSYMLWVIFVHKILLKKSPKVETTWEAEVKSVELY